MRYVLILFLLYSISPSFAKEGFSTDFTKVNSMVNNWGRHTLMVFSETGQGPVGTAFLIYNKNDIAYFVSAKHVSNFCKTPNVCSLRWGTPWTAHLPLGSIEYVSKIKLPVTGIAQFKPAGREWYASNYLTDISIFRTTSIPELPSIDLNSVGPMINIPFGIVKDVRHFIIGYPYLAARTSLKTEADSRIVQLRISEGATIRTVAKTDVALNDDAKFIIVSDADSLGGNSGGPVIEETGQLLGVLVGGPNIKNLEYSSLDYSYVTPINYIKYMLGDILLGRIQFTE